MLKSILQYKYGLSYTFLNNIAKCKVILFQNFNVVFPIISTAAAEVAITEYLQGHVIPRSIAAVWEDVDGTSGISFLTGRVQ